MTNVVKITNGKISIFVNGTFKEIRNKLVKEIRECKSNSITEFTVFGYTDDSLRSKSSAFLSVDESLQVSEIRHPECDSDYDVDMPTHQLHHSEPNKFKISPFGGPEIEC